jgi:DNA-binding NarL/FixJ family response regulator
LLGFDIDLTKNGIEAIKKYKDAIKSQSHYDFVIMDLTVSGGMGAKEAVKQILSDDPNAKVIVSSGISNDPIFENYAEFGFRAALKKPYTLQSLSETINIINNPRRNN